MTLTHMWACACGAETPCSPSDHLAGAVYQCPACKAVFGCVRAKSGHRVWISITQSDIDFHDLLTIPQPGA